MAREYIDSHKIQQNVGSLQEWRAYNTKTVAANLFYTFYNLSKYLMKNQNLNDKNIYLYLQILQSN